MIITRWMMRALIIIWRTSIRFNNTKNMSQTKRTNILKIVFCKFYGALANLMHLSATTRISAFIGFSNNLSHKTWLVNEFIMQQFTVIWISVWSQQGSRLFLWRRRVLPTFCLCLWFRRLCFLLLCGWRWRFSTRFLDKRKFAIFAFLVDEFTLLLVSWTLVASVVFRLEPPTQVDAISLLIGLDHRNTICITLSSSSRNTGRLRWRGYLWLVVCLTWVLNVYHCLVSIPLDYFLLFLISFNFIGLLRWTIY